MPGIAGGDGTKKKCRLQARFTISICIKDVTKAQYLQCLDHKQIDNTEIMPTRVTCGLVFFLGYFCVVKSDAGADPDDMRRVVDHRKVKKYFLELYNEALAKAI